MKTILGHVAVLNGRRERTLEIRIRAAYLTKADLAAGDRLTILTARSGCLVLMRTQKRDDRNWTEAAARAHIARIESERREDKRRTRAALSSLMV